MTRLESGATLLHYRIIEKIGEGGMGEVYKAEDRKLGRRVAIKLLSSEATEDEKAKKRLLREARAASTLNHPNIVTVYAIEEAEGMDFIAMEYVEGESLRARIERGPMEVEDLLGLGSQLSRALSAAHEVGLIHRDIKPGNILTTPDGQAKLVDFGLAGTIRPQPEEVKSEEATLEALTDERASQRCAFSWGEVSYGELLLYNMRHVQEHASQLAWILGRTTGSAPGWVTKAKS